MSINLQLVRYVVAGAVLFVLAVIVALVIVLVLRGLPATGPQIVSLLGVVGTLVALLSGLLGIGAVTVATQQIQQDVNGHLQAHMGHTDAQVRQIVQAELNQAQVKPGGITSGGERA